MVSILKTLQLQQVIQVALDWLFPPQCAGCQRGGTVLCPCCIAQIKPLASARCYYCCSLLDPGGLCPSCYYQPLRMNGLRATSLHTDPLRSCIHALKYAGNTRLAEPLGALLARTCMAYNMQADIIVPVPLHSERERQRGYNQAHLLAKVCAARTGLPLHDTVVQRVRATPPQVGLTASERKGNVFGAFSCTHPLATETLSGRKILIVDDVCSTGATLEACAAPLLAAGALSVWGLVLARPSEKETD